jgi:hypothetical protein
MQVHVHPLDPETAALFLFCRATPSRHSEAVAAATDEESALREEHKKEIPRADHSKVFK